MRPQFRLRDLFWLTAVVAAMLGGYCWRNDEVAYLKWVGEYDCKCADDARTKQWEAEARAGFLQRQVTALDKQREPWHTELITLRGLIRKQHEDRKKLPAEIRRSLQVLLPEIDDFGDTSDFGDHAEPARQGEQP